MLSPDQRSTRARIGAHASWAMTADRAKRVQPAVDARLAVFESRVDPDGELDPAVRRQRAEQLRRSHMLSLAAKSAKARAAKKAS